MRDPHVSVLRYQVVIGESVRFDSPPPLEQETEAYRLRLAPDVLTVEMKGHHPSIEMARRLVEPDLRAWEIDTGLRFGPGAMSFIYQSADVVDRNPESAAPDREINILATNRVFVVDAATARLVQHQYPAPPSGFVVSPDVETTWRRYEGYLAGREPLASMAYMCLTVLEVSAGSRKDAGKLYGVDMKVLNKLGDLTSNVGDQQTARKVPRGGSLRPHTPAEIAWVKAVIERLIRRVGEYTFDPNSARATLGMVDFPNLAP